MSRKSTNSVSSSIEIVGAQVNNLANLDVTFPVGAVTLLTGVSGSGKSSLLVDTLATEGNARMRRFLGLGQDHLDDVEPHAFVGRLPPTLHFSQGAFRSSRRTTVGTCSGWLATLRTLFVRHGVPWSEEVNEVVPPPSTESYLNWLKRHVSGQITVWAVPMRHVRGDGLRAVSILRRLGFSSIVVRSETDPPALQKTGRIIAIDDFRQLDVNVKHVIEAKVARMPLPAALDIAFKAGGAVVLELPDASPGMEDLCSPYGVLLDSDRHWVHPKVLRPYASPTTALFSFNQPSSERSGACSACQGLGEVLVLAEDRLVIHPERSMHEGAFELWTPKCYKYVNIQHETIEGLRDIDGFDPNVPWRKLTQKARKLILNGGVEVVDRDLVTGRRLGKARPFVGFAEAVIERYQKGTKTSEHLAAFVEERHCPECKGNRWSRSARAIRVGGYSLPDLLALPSSELAERCSTKGDLRSSMPSPARPALDQLLHLADSLKSVGLGHLSGDRGMMTLSEGESRRLRLAGILFARGQGLALLLDEPARGLHEEDVSLLIRALRDLKRRHTVILNEHRFALASVVDHVVKIGPGAGRHGGRIVQQGSPKEVLTDDEHTLRKRLEVPPHHPSLEVKGANLHNLQDVSCRIPLGRLVAVTGVSGSGKSTFVRGILLPALLQELGDRVILEGFSTLPGGRWKRFSGTKGIQDVVAVEQRRPDTNRRSLVATYLGIAETLRRTYGSSSDARKMGLLAQDFGLNSGKGRCGSCLGLGEVDDGVGFVVCADCGGRRFSSRALSVKVAGLDMAELLDCPVADLAENLPSQLTSLADLIQLLVDLDLGYLTLGRRLDRLSGGEIQRLRIVERLSRAKAKGMLLVLDEPAAGLHPLDVDRLLRVLDRIVGSGENTVLVIEHNLSLIRASDWIVDFGPGGGPAGGRILAQGSLATISIENTPTGRALRKRNPIESSCCDKMSSTSAFDSKGQSSTQDEARRARQWLKVLLGHEIRLPTEDDGPGVDKLAIFLEDLMDPNQRPYEVGGLDLELARLFLKDAPLGVSPSHLSRSNKVGRCAACQGSGQVMVPDIGLVVGDKRQAPLSEVLLVPAARTILKGVRRLVQIPFFRRFELEGQWDSKKSFSRLSEDERQTLLFGHWSRPGHGSFLKNSQADHEKVSSWLRWDGLFFHILDQLDRSKDSAWVTSVRKSLVAKPCVICGGSGLGGGAGQVSRDGRTLQDWLNTGTVGELYRALLKSNCDSSRERRIRDRVICGLQIIAKQVPDAPLCEPLDNSALILETLRIVTSDYLTLPLIDPEQ